MDQHQKQSPHSPKRVAVPVLVKDGKPCSGSGSDTGSASSGNAHAQQTPPPGLAQVRQQVKCQTRVLPPTKPVPTVPQRPTPVSVTGPVQQRTITTNTAGVVARPPGTVLQHHAELHNSALSHQVASCQSTGSASSSRSGQMSGLASTDLGAMHAAHLAHSTGYVSHAASMDIMSRSCVFNDRTW